MLRFRLLPVCFSQNQEGGLGETFGLKGFGTGHGHGTHERKNHIWKSKLDIYYRVWFVLAHILGAVSSAISSGSPVHLSVESHTSEDLLLGSLQSTLDPSKSSWEPSSLSATQQGRTSSKKYLVKSS